MEEMNENRSELNSTPEENKVFVGNVPFQCTREEFQECFKDMEGYIDADIIRRFKSKISRGFGFVVFKEKEQAQKLLENENVQLRDRVLRLSPYVPESKEKTYSNPQRTNQIFVRNLTDEVTNDDLRIHFTKYGEVVSSFVTSSNGKTFGMVSFKEKQSYIDALKNEIQFEVYPFKKKRVQAQRESNSDPGSVYRAGFRAGQIVGYQKGFNDGLVSQNSRGRHFESKPTNY